MSALSFLGLARKAGKVEMGEDYIAMAARAGKAKLIITASDAGKSTVTRAENASGAAHCPVAALPFTRDELGAALGKGAVSAAAITDIHLAHAFMEKLSAERAGFEDIRAGLAEKDKKAMERQREAKRHQRNLRTGKSRK